MPKIVVDKNRCKGCERCVVACPAKVIAMSRDLNAKGYFYAYAAEQPRCLGCRLCAITCPDMAIQVYVQGTQYAFFEY
jgi:2-oxoglutarate ferredoxin oxidoreductase subunit delta